MILKEMMKMTNVGMGKLKGQKYCFRQVYFHKLSVPGRCEFGLALPRLVCYTVYLLCQICLFFKPQFSKFDLHSNGACTKLIKLVPSKATACSTVITLHW